MVTWTEGVVREQVPLWSSLIANSMYQAVSKHATKIFKDGDLIEVNANKGIVRKLP